MAVISELHNFCFPGENAIDTNNDYHVLINCYLFDMGRAFSLCYYFISFVKMLYAQHNYSLGRSSFPFLCVCSFTSTDAFMLNKCFDFGDCIQNLFTQHPTVSSRRSSAMFHIPPKFFIFKASLRFF